MSIDKLIINKEDNVTGFLNDTSILKVLRYYCRYRSSLFIFFNTFITTLKIHCYLIRETRTIGFDLYVTPVCVHNNSIGISLRNKYMCSTIHLRTFQCP